MFGGTSIEEVDVQVASLLLGLRLSWVEGVDELQGGGRSIRDPSLVIGYDGEGGKNGEAVVWMSKDETAVSEGMDEADWLGEGERFFPHVDLDALFTFGRELLDIGA